jgi:hypothetical protein
MYQAFRALDATVQSFAWTLEHSPHLGKYVRRLYIESWEITASIHRMPNIKVLWMNGDSEVPSASLNREILLLRSVERVNFASGRFTIMEDDHELAREAWPRLAKLTFGTVEHPLPSSLLLDRLVPFSSLRLLRWQSTTLHPSSFPTLIADTLREIRLEECEFDDAPEDAISNLFGAHLQSLRRLVFIDNVGITNDPFLAWIPLMTSLQKLAFRDESYTVDPWTLPHSLVSCRIKWLQCQPQQVVTFINSRRGDDESLQELRILSSDNLGQNLTEDGESWGRITAWAADWAGVSFSLSQEPLFSVSTDVTDAGNESS